MPGTISQYQVVIAGQIITASLWNGMELNIINNGLIPSGIDDYSATDGQMQTQTDPYPGGVTSRPTSLQGEMERVRFQFDNIIGKTYWYEDPDVDIATFKTRFDAHTHDGTSNNGPQILTSGIADLAVTTAKIDLLAVTNGRIANGAVGTTQLADANVTTAKLDSSLTIQTLDVGTALSWKTFTQLKILQIVQATQSTSSTSTSGTFTNSNVTASITPKINTSKILIFATGTATTASGTGGFLTIARDGTNLGSSTGFCAMPNGESEYMSIVYYDSPATVSAITYSVQYRVLSGGNIQFPSNAFAATPTATLILVEVAQ